MGIGKIPAPEIAAEAAQVEVAPDLGMRQQGSYLGAEDEPPVALGVVEGFLPHPIPGGKERLPPGIPEDEGEHSVEMREALLAELLVGVDDHLGVGARREPVPPLTESFGQALEVVDFAVEDRVHGARLVGDRLAAGGKIDDLQAAVAQRDRTVDVVPFIVGATMAQRGRHPANDGRIGALLIEREEAAKAAHVTQVRDAGDRSPARGF